jgi:hypothetical protein
MKWENFGAFLSSLLRREIFLTGAFLSDFHCISIKNAHVYCSTDSVLLKTQKPYTYFYTFILNVVLKVQSLTHIVWIGWVTELAGFLHL